MFSLLFSHFSDNCHRHRPRYGTCHNGGSGAEMLAGGVITLDTALLASIAKQIMRRDAVDGG